MKLHGLAALFIGCAAACAPETPFPACNDAASGARPELICDLAIRYSAADPGDDAAIRTLTISARIEQLIGGAKASAISSAGNFGDVEAGGEATVLLLPAGELGAAPDIYRGELQLALPYGRGARVDVLAAETSTHTFVPPTPEP